MDGWREEEMRGDEGGKGVWGFEVMVGGWWVVLCCERAR